MFVFVSADNAGRRVAGQGVLGSLSPPTEVRRTTPVNLANLKRIFCPPPLPDTHTHYNTSSSEARSILLSKVHQNFASKNLKIFRGWYPHRGSRRPPSAGERSKLGPKRWTPPLGLGKPATQLIADMHCGIFQKWAEAQTEPTAGLPSNATYAAHVRKYSRKYVTNALHTRKVRNKRSWRNCRLLLQFNAAQQNEFLSSATNKVKWTKINHS